MKQLTYWQKMEPHFKTNTPPPNFETIKKLIKQSTQQKFSQEAIASCNKTQRQNKKNKPRNHAVANFRPNTGHDHLAAHLRHIKISDHNRCTICKLENTIIDKDHLLVCPKLDHTSSELPKLYWDARRLIE
jgi:hypothetical protein